MKKGLDNSNIYFKRPDLNMSKSKGKKLLFIGAFLFLVACGNFMGVTDTQEATSSDAQVDVVETVEEASEEEILQVHFIDVGQGDATLVTCDNEAMLIDAGDNSKGTTVQLYLKKQGIKELKYLILTHPDADHIGGADVVVSKFDIENVFMSDFTKDNETYQELVDALDYKRLKWSTPSVGNSYSLGSAEFTIIAPNTVYDDPNNSSIGLLLKNGNTTFLFTGDAEEEAEYDILANGLNIDCDVYKAGHHGSRTASTEELLRVITPSYVVISCAEDNSYGHPHAEPMNRFRSMKMNLYRTDEQGSIIATSNGTEIVWNCVPSDNWRAGENTQSASKEESFKSESDSSQDESSALVEPVPQPEPTLQPQPEPEPMPQPSGGNYAVNSNNNNGKIHIVGACQATGTGENAMKKPVYFNTYEEAEAYSVSINPGLDKRKCGNCWK